MKRIFKYPIPFEDDITLQLPIKSKILTFQSQNGEPCVWVLVDDIYEDTKVSYRFRMIGTGHPIPDADSLDYIGTAQFNNGRLVFHLFILGENI